MRCAQAGAAQGDSVAERRTPTCIIMHATPRRLCTSQRPALLASSTCLRQDFHEAHRDVAVREGQPLQQEAPDDKGKDGEGSTQGSLLRH